MDLTLFLQSMASGLLNGGVYSLVALGITLVFGVIGIVNFAHGTFLMLSMFLSYWLFQLTGINPYIALPINAVVFFTFGYLLQKHLISRVIGAAHHVQLLLTIGVTVVLENLALMLWGSDTRTVILPFLHDSLRIGSVVVSPFRLIAFIGAMLVTIALFIVLKFTPFGMSIRACSQNRDKASLLGVNVSAVYAVAFGIGTACAAIAGSLIVPFFYTVPHVGNTFLNIAFVVVIIGGMSSFKGALISGLLVGLVEAVCAAFLPGTLYQAVPFIMLIIILLFKPSGLFAE
jgi:branched-chain amino acid transport system permease protein